MRYRRLFEAAQEGILILDARTGQVLDVNPFLLNLLGYSMETFLEKKLWEIGLFQDIAPSQAAFLELQDKGYIRYEDLPLETRDGRRIEVEFVSNVYWVNDEKVIQCNVRDISKRKRAEAALRESEFALKRSQAIAHVGHWTWDTQANTVIWSDEMYHIFGIDPASLTGNLDEVIHATIHPDDKARVLKSNETVLTEQKPESLEYRVVWADGTVRHVWSQDGESVVDDKGNIVRLSGIVQDITERKRAEEALAAEHRLLRTLIDSLPDRIYAKDTEGQFILKNETDAYQMGAASPDETIGKTDFDYYPPELAAQYHADDQAVIQSGQPLINREEPVVDADGNQGWLLTSKVPLSDDQGKVIGLVGIGRDITERKQMEKVLQQERNLLRTLIDTLPDYIFVKDRQGRFVVSNLAHTQSVPHATLADLIGKTALELYPPELGQQFHTDDIWVMDSGEMLINAERQTYNPDGTRRWVLTSKVPLKGTDGQIVGLVGVSRDITERKRLADAERDARILAEALRDTAAVLTSTLDPAIVMARILENVDRVVPHDYASILIIEGEVASPAYCRGWLPDEETAFRALRFPLETPNLREMILTHRPVIIPDIANYPGWVRVVSHMRAYIGVPICAHDQVVGFLNLLSSEPGFFTPVHAERLSAFADQAATALENAQLYEELRRHASELERRVQERTAQLNHAKERIEAILNSSSDIMVLCRVDGTIEQVNPAFEIAFNTRSDEALLQPLTRLVISQHIPILDQAFRTVVETRQPTRVEVTVHYGEGVTFDADVVLSPVVEPNDRLLGVVCSLRNITERRRMEDQLRHTVEHEMELSELKTRYVSMAAHDLRNPLAVIQTSVGLLWQYSDRLTDEQKLANYDRVRTSIKVMVDLLDDILTIGQVESSTLRFDPAPLDLGAFCRYMVEEEKQTIGAAQRISFSDQGACGTAYVDVKLLRHILGNLLSNAIKYSPEESTVTFTVDCESDQITFRIQDQGIGIPQADQARLFEAFHRASNARQVPGTGLGLAIVKQSVDLHGGTLTFESEEGVGTTFTVILPQRSTEK